LKSSKSSLDNSQSIGSQIEPMVLPLESEGQLHQINTASLIPDQPIKPVVLHQLATGQTLDTMSLEQPTTAHPQLSSSLKSESTTNTLVGGGVGTFTTLMGYQKASLAAGDTAMLLTNNGITANGENTNPTTTCTSGLADLSWASNDSAVNFCFQLISHFIVLVICIRAHCIWICSTNGLSESGQSNRFQ
jgi:hypothetical protein